MSGARAAKLRDNIPSVLDYSGTSEIPLAEVGIVITGSLSRSQVILFSRNGAWAARAPPWVTGWFPRM